MERRLKVELFEQIRREYEHGCGTIVGTAHRFGVHRKMVRQVIECALPPERKKPERKRAKFDAVKDFIQRILREDERAPRKQRHTARRIFSRLQTEMPQTEVSERSIRKYVEQIRASLGWKMSRNDRNCVETKKFIASGDFNGDKKTDYAVKFVKGRTGYILAFVSQKTDYKAHVLESAPASEMKFTVLDVERKGKKYPIGGDIPDWIYGKLPNDAPYTIPCESDAVAFYVYKNGRFQ